jgi:hypothetical protein
VSVPVWAWVAFVAFVVAMLALDLFVLHRRAQEVSLKEAARWTAVWLAIGLGFGGLLWAWEGESTAQAYLAGYLIEKSLSLDNVFVFAVIFAAFAIPARYQHRVLMFGLIGALIMRAAFIVAGVTLLEAFHPVIYVFGAVLLYAAVKMVRGGQHARPEDNRVLRGGAPDPARHRGPARPAVRGPGGRPRAGHAAADGADRGRDHRPDLRRRLDPGRPGRHHRHVRGLHVQRVRPAGHAGAVLPAGRCGGPVPPPAARAGDHPGRGRGQAADRRPLRGPGLGLARLHRRRPGRRRHPVHP